MGGESRPVVTSGGWCDQCAATGRRAAIERHKTQGGGARLTSAVQPCQPPAQVNGVSQYVPRLVPGRDSCRAGRVRRLRNPRTKCKSYGAEHGTDDYVQCRLAIDMQKANAERAAASLPGGR